MVKLHRMLKLLVCIGLITTFAGCAASQKKESTGQYLDDSVITTKVKTAIFEEATLKTLQINVETLQRSGSAKRLCQFGAERQKSRRGCRQSYWRRIGEKRPGGKIAA